MQERIGIMGGTFDPVHLGHLAIARAARDAIQLDGVVWIPARIPPHKQGRAVASATDRLAMLRQAIEGEPGWSISEIELLREGPSYTVDTLRALRTSQPDVEWCFIAGADSLFELHAWREIAELLRLCRFITVARPGHPLSVAWPDSLGLDTETGARLLADVVTGPLLDISSSAIRARLGKGEPIRHLVPSRVADYIAAHQLYRVEE